MLGWMKTRVWPVVQTVIDRWDKDEGFLRSAALAYYAALSLLPLCLVLMAGLGMVAEHSDVFQQPQNELLSLIEDTTSPWMAEQLGELLKGVKTQAGVGGPLGIVVLIVTAIGIFTQLDTALDRMWGNPGTQNRGIWGAIREALVDRLMAFLMLTGLGLLLIALMLANLALAGVREYVEHWSVGSFFLRTAQILLSPMLYAVVFSILYRVLPRAKVRWSEAIRGGLFVAVVWSIGQHVLEWLVLGDKYSAYGVVGSFIAILAWFYYASMAVLMGAEVVRVAGEGRK
jgi:membrane protein